MEIVILSPSCLAFACSRLLVGDEQFSKPRWRNNLELVARFGLVARYMILIASSVVCCAV